MLYPGKWKIYPVTAKKIPKNKHQITNKFQNPDSNSFGFRVSGWSAVGITLNYNIHFAVGDKVL